jgi:nuclear pore complex protein Nup98-Nup96
LELQRQHSRIETDASGVPKAIADTALRFQHFAELFEPDDQSHESSMWRLCRALFDEIDDGIHDGTLPDVRARISSLRRKTSLSDWLAETVAPSVEKDLRQESTSRAARRLFLLMTGHQLERAAQLAFDVGDFNLSLLLPQAGGDADFRNDIEQLLEAWTDQHLDAHIDMSYRKVYALLQGIVDHLPGSKSTDVIELSQDVNISEGLDWKRVFGLHLWFANSLEEPTRDALSSYFETSESNPEYASPPLPWYIEDRSANSKSARRGVHDSQFELIKLATDETTPLESAIDPLGFGPNPLSYRLPWHIYLVLSRILHGRDFSDRSVPGGNADVELSAVEGISAKANAVCCNFALQLECQGLWQFAVFVLLHLELANRCKHFIWISVRTLTVFLSVDGKQYSAFSVVMQSISKVPQKSFFSTIYIFRYLGYWRPK